MALSLRQERLWFLDQLEGERSQACVQAVVRLEGDVDPEALLRALGAVVERHEILRTSFPGQRGRPEPVVAPSSAGALTPLPHQRELELARGPLFRYGVAGRNRNPWLFLAAHPIVADARSLATIVSELAALYAAFVGETPPPALDAALPWRACAVRQQEAGERDAERLAWWRERLAGAPALMELPTDRPRGQRASYREGVHWLDLDAPDAATQVVLLTALQALLLRYTGQADVVIGVSTSGRRAASDARVVGPLENTLVVRSDLAGNPSLAALLARAREVLQAAADRELSFERLLEALQPARSLSHAPLVQVRLDAQLGLRDPVRAAGVSFVIEELTSDAAGLDLIVARAGRRVALRYNAALFDAATAARWADHMRALLAALASCPETRVQDVPLLTDAEQRQILVAWNAATLEVPREALLHEFFEEQALRRPEAIAIVCDDERLSYGELEQRSNRLAHQLQRLGVAPESRVGVCLERRPELVVALLAVLKAGAAYVPLDPAYPSQRIAAMLDDSGCAVVLTQESLTHRLPAQPARVFCLDAAAAAGTGDERLERRTLPSNLAYVIYTSGSTGRPKGVAIAHDSAVAFLVWARTVFDAEQLAGVLASTSICFDLSIFELFVTLGCGGTVILVESALHLPSTPARDSVRLVNTVPSAMAELVRASRLPRSVRTVNLAGEALTAGLVRQLYALDHVAHVYNLYGPSEDTTYSTVARMSPDSAEEPSIGAPIANSRAYVLDPRLRPVPIGVIGELYLAGDGLARGYLNRPDLTADRFVPDPFAPRPGGRLYRTGDLARWRAGGSLDFLGRADHQVKVRGFRIELGEIEAALLAHADVGEAVVVARLAGEGQQLVAYLVPHAGASPTAEQLLRHLRRTLPEYMLPSHLVSLDALPRTPNGKLNRAALPEPVSVRSETALVAPRTPTQDLLAGIYAEVLNVARVGVGDSFFELGGHSLLAARVAVRAREIFGVDVSLLAVFEEPTVGGLAARVDALRRAGAAMDDAPLRSAAGPGPHPLSFAQQRLWFMDQLTPGSALYNVPCGLRLEGPLELPALRHALATIVARHAVLRTRFELQDGAPVQVVDPASPLPLPVLDLRRRADLERQLQSLVDAEAQRPFDLRRGPLLRTTLVRLAEDVHLLLLTVHHVVFDGWSSEVFVRELAAAYAAQLGSPEAAPLAALPVQYADYAVWQRQWLAGELESRQLAYWTERLRGAAPVLELPTDRPRPAEQTFRGGVHRFQVSEAAALALGALGRCCGATLFMTLLATWKALLFRLGGQSDVLVATPVANRSRGEVEALIGFFANTLVLRTDLSGDPTFRELLARVRQTALGAYAHEDLPFERLVEELQPQRSLSFSPLFQVMFTLERNPTPTASACGLRLRLSELPNGMAKYDLMLILRERPEGLEGVLEYASDLFDPQTATRMIRSYLTLLEAAAAQPDQRLSRLPLLASDERRRVLEDLNHTGSGAGESCLHQLFEAQAVRTPDAEALRYEGRSLTYAELDARADRLAASLRAGGVGPDTRVGICMQRSVEMVEAVLGVLKAGGAYVPLDPAYPRDRLAFMLAEARVTALLTQSTLAGTLPEGCANVLCLDAPEAWPQARASAKADVHPDNLVYVIYTSGSSGRPKGVAMTHRALSNLMQWQLGTLSREAAARTLQFASLSFDVHCQEMFSTWSSGGALVLVSDDVRRDPQALLRVLREQRITRLYLPFVAVQQLAEVACHEGSWPESLRELVTAGEQLQTTRQVVEWFEALPSCSLHNHYGPSETHVVTAHRLTGAPASWPVLPPIGTPIAGTRVYILDRHLEPVPLGVTGELYLGGTALARGYLDRPELTAERFVPDPFGTPPGQRLYRTGDLARYRGDGAIEFLGRADQQVKIRGFRIELGEIEAVLAQHPALRDVALAAHEESGRPGRMLVAYFVAATGQVPSALELRRFLQERLPEYMVPALFVRLEAFPLTASGKIDRRALPAPERRRDDVSLCVPPRNGIEAAIADVWRELLGLPELGVHDDFFDLGGHSLLGTRVLSRLRGAFGIDLPAAALFRAPTVARLATLVVQRRAEGEGVAELLAAVEGLSDDEVQLRLTAEARHGGTE